MRKPLLLLLLLGSITILNAQNRLPHSPLSLPIARWTTLAEKLNGYFKKYIDEPLDLKSSIPDSLFQQWRSYEFVKDEEQVSKYLIIITLDGLRWQEVFTGADSILWKQALQKNRLPLQAEDFWAATPEKRREKLMPFLESVQKSVAHLN